MPPIESHPRGSILKIHLQPGTKKTEISGFHGERIKIKVSAPPREGKANEALLSFLAAKLGLRERELEILAGQKSRDKIVLVPGKTLEEITRLLNSLWKR